MILLTDEEIIGAMRLNPNKSYWSEKDWDAQITREIKLVTKAQLKKARDNLSDEWLEINLAHKLEDVVKKAPEGAGHYIYYRAEAKHIVKLFQALLEEVKE